MRRITLLLLLAIAVCGFARTRHAADTDVYGVAFYNLENLFDTINANGKYDLEFSPQGARKWNSDKYWRKVNNLAYAISSMTTASTPGGPAVIGIAEVENVNVVRDLVGRIDSTLTAQGRDPWKLGIVHHDSPDRRGIDVGLLYDPARFKVSNVTNHTLIVEGNPDFLTRDQLCVSGELAGQPMSFIVNHWPSRLGGQEESNYLREAAAALTRHIADSLWAVNPRQGIVVMGDLNDDPFNSSCAGVLSALKFPDATPVHGFFNPFWQILDAGQGTLTYRGAWNLFDQIIVSGNLLLTPVNTDPLRLCYDGCRVFNPEFLRDKSYGDGTSPHRTYARGQFLNGYSDHFPTEIFLRLNRR